jgi:hypothetical protein
LNFQQPGSTKTVFEDWVSGPDLDLDSEKIPDRIQDLESRAAPDVRPSVIRSVISGIFGIRYPLSDPVKINRI